jgi:hypothetical protein
MDGATIRKQLSGLGPRKRGGRLPEPLRREIAAYARRRRSAGIRLSDIDSARSATVSRGRFGPLHWRIKELVAERNTLQLERGPPPERRDEPIQ